MYSTPRGGISKLAQKYGGKPSNQTNSHGTIAYFETLEAGKAAQRELWNRKPNVAANPKRLRYSEMPLQQAISIWAPGAPIGYSASLIKAAKNPSNVPPMKSETTTYIAANSPTSTPSVASITPKTSSITTASSTPEQQGRVMIAEGLSYNPPMNGNGGGGVVVNNVNALQTAVNNGGGNQGIPIVSDPSPTLRSVLG